jgi:MinD superfamily P-loop ATPase
MGLAVVNEATCVTCGDCVPVCKYLALEWMPGELPVVLADRCTGCGECQATCVRTRVLERRELAATAIEVVAGAREKELRAEHERGETVEEESRGY